MKVKHLFFFFIQIMLVAVSCDSHTHDHPEDDPDHAEEGMADAPNEVHLGKVQLNNIGIEYESVQLRNLRSLVKLNGRVELPSDGISIATTPLEGQVDQVHVLPGQKVNRGQVLFTIRNMDLIDWQEQRVQFLADLDFLNAEIERQQYLSEREIAPIRKLEELLAERKKVESAVAAIDARLAVSGIDRIEEGGFRSTFNIRAPSGGTVQHLNVHKGSYATPQTEMVRILSNHHLRIHLFAFETDISLLDEGQLIDFFVQSRPTSIRKAKIVWINNLVNEENNSYEIHADIVGDKSGLVPGEYVEARVINREEMVKSLSIEAITKDKGLTYVFVKKEDHEDESHFEKVQVRIGEQDLGFVEVMPIDPLPDDAVIVAKGAFFLMAHSKKDEGGGGHEH